MVTASRLVLLRSGRDPGRSAEVGGVEPAGGGSPVGAAQGRVACPGVSEAAAGLGATHL